MTSSVIRPITSSMSSGRSMPEPQKTCRIYSTSGSASGSCAEMWRTRGFTVKLTSTRSSRVGSEDIAQNEQRYSERSNALSAYPDPMTPPQPGHSMFQDRSNNPIRDACRRAPMIASSPRRCAAANASGLSLFRARSEPVSTRSFIDATTAGSADCRNVSQSASTSSITPPSQTARPYGIAPFES